MKLTKYLTIVLCLSLNVGCASLYVPALPNYSLPEHTRIGLFVSASEFPKHTHVGTTIFNNFSKDYEYPWKMEESIFKTFQQEIEHSTGFVVLNLKDLGITNTSELNFVEVKDKQWSLVEENTSLRDSLIELGIYAVVSISESPTLANLECSAYGCAEHYSEGYGLFTRSFLGINSYFASSSFTVSIEIIDTPADIGVQQDMRDILHFNNKNKILTNFEAPKEFRNITQEELNPIREEILNYIKYVAAAAGHYFVNSSPKSEIKQTKEADNPLH